jgi:hypothetical protein
VCDNSVGFDMTYATKFFVAFDTGATFYFTLGKEGR